MESIREQLTKAYAKCAVTILLMHRPDDVALETFYRSDLRLVRSPKAKAEDIGPAKHPAEAMLTEDGKINGGGAMLTEDGELQLRNRRYQGHVPGVDGRFLRRVRLPKWLHWETFEQTTTQMVGKEPEGFDAYIAGLIWYI